MDRSPRRKLLRRLADSTLIVKFHALVNLADDCLDSTIVTRPLRGLILGVGGRNVVLHLELTDLLLDQLLLGHNFLGLGDWQGYSTLCLVRTVLMTMAYIRNKAKS